MEALDNMDYVAVAQTGFSQAHWPKGLNAHNFHRVPFIAFNRKDNLQHSFVVQSFGLSRVGLKQLFVPSSEGLVRAVQASWWTSRRATAWAWHCTGTAGTPAPTYWTR